jgi:hypothetical protein
MQLFLKLFEPCLQWFYHCFDRIVINGYLSFFTREINVAWFFRQVCQKPKVTKEVLTERTRAYRAWVVASHRVGDPLDDVSQANFLFDKKTGQPNTVRLGLAGFGQIALGFLVHDVCALPKRDESH